MTLHQISYMHGRIDRVTMGRTPVVQIDLQPNQRIVHFTCRAINELGGRDRKTMDWRWTAWIDNDLGEPG